MMEVSDSLLIRSIVSAGISMVSIIVWWLVYTHRSAAILIDFIAISSAVIPSMSTRAVAAAIREVNLGITYIRRRDLHCRWPQLLSQSRCSFLSRPPEL